MKPSGLDLQAELGGPLLAPSHPESPVPAAPPPPRGDDRPDLEIVVALGNIIHTTSRLILLGQFTGSEPSSAWRSVDKAMDGALSRLSKRQAGVGPRGSVDVVPTGRYFIMADHIVFLSLGALSEFYTTPTTLESAFEHGVRGLLVCQTEEFVTVLMGDNPPEIQDTAGKIRYALQHMLAGFLAALSGEREGARFRRLTIAETDPQRRDHIVRIITDLVETGMFSRFALDHSVKVLRENLREDDTKNLGIRNNQLQLKSRINPATGEPDEVTFTFSPSTPRAAVRAEAGLGFDSVSLHPIYQLAGAALPSPAAVRTRSVDTIAQLETLSEAVTDLIPKPIRDEMLQYNKAGIDGRSPRLILLDDHGSSAIPWECIRIGSDYPALSHGLSRLFTTFKLKIVETMPPQPDFRVLLVINATEDLDGADKEGKDIITIYRENVPDAVFDVLEGPAATVTALKDKLAKEYYHVLHFAGHSSYHRGPAAGNARTSGLMMADGYFTGDDALALPKAPGVVVFNSCESARIHRRGAPAPPLPSGDAPGDKREEAQRSVTVAEAFINAGIGHFIGTFWPVSDTAALAFCRELYRHLAAYATMGDAIIHARRELASRSMPDWANYIHYGDPGISPFPETRPQS